MPSGLKKYHTKTKNGCGQCKKRRVRCNLRPPTCSNCERRGEICDYASLYPASLEATNKPLRQVGTEKTDAQWDFILWRSPQPSPSNPEHGELLHHFSISTSLTASLLDHKDFHQIWQQQVPQEAQAHTFLLHGMLGFAALHLSHLHGSNIDRYRMLADQERTKALETFQAAVSNITPDNCTAIFLFSIMVTFCQFAMHINSHTLQLHEQLEAIISALRALRGSWYLTGQYWALVEKGPLGDLLSRPRGPEAAVLDPETALVLDDLESLSLFTSSYTETEKSIYAETIQTLSEWYGLVSSNPRTWAHIVRWPATLSREFFALLEQNRPMALVILAYWCVPVHHAPHRWFVEGWARHAVWAIARSVGPAYAPAMAWPLSQIGWDFELGPEDRGVHVGTKSQRSRMFLL